MDKHDQLPFTGYLSTIQAQLGELTPEQRERILQELQQHLHDAAQHSGANPDDPVFQAEVIQRLGPGQQLGRAFARTYRTPLMTRHNLTYLAGGGAAAVSLLVLATALPIGILLRDAHISMNMVTGAPVALLPTIIVLHSVYAPLQPRRSQLALLCGIVGVLTLFFWTVWHDLIEFFGVHDTALHVPLDVLNAYSFISLPLTGLIGAWFICIGQLSRTTRIPTAPEFSWMSTATGIASLALLGWMSIYGSFVTSTGSVPPFIQAISTPLSITIIMSLLICYLIWTGGTAMWLLQQRSSPPPKVV